MLQLETVLPYSIWPEELQWRLNEMRAVNDKADIWNMANRDCIEQLLDIVRKDFREKEKIDLNRDIFVRPM